MEYTTFVERAYEPLIGGGYDKLNTHLKLDGNGVPLYILAISEEDCSLKILKEKMKGVKGIDTDSFFQVDGTIDLVVSGEDAYKHVANALFERTRAPIGIVKYNKHNGQDPLNLYLDLTSALDIAREERRMYHVFNPDQDSLQAIIANALREPSLK